jgi:uracil phosphoribosyltransferase
VVTGEVEGHVVDKLHNKKFRVLAFGDGPLDIEMLEKADQAFIVVGDGSVRSKSIDAALEKAITCGLKASQILLPGTAEPRLDLTRLPQRELNQDTIHILLRRSFIHATDKNARKLLQTPMRDKSNAGHDLREAHEQAGYHLATEYLSDLLGVTQYDMPHVQGKATDGYRFQDEDDTLIVPLMRGSEPMALGVARAMKRASFVHAKHYTDIDKRLLEKNRTIILVDSVINTGGSIMGFMKPLRQQFSDQRVVVVAGVVNAEALGGTELTNLSAADPNLTLVALRVSSNSYVGSGGTDTGDRLFDTTYI